MEGETRIALLPGLAAARISGATMRPPPRAKSRPSDPIARPPSAARSDEGSLGMVRQERACSKERDSLSLPFPLFCSVTMSSGPSAKR